MYNPHKKNAFINKGNFTEKETEKIKSRFELSAPFEKELDKDLCEFNVDEISAMFRSRIENVTPTTVMRDNDTYRAYAEYATSRGWTEKNNFQHEYYVSIFNDVDARDFYTPSDIETMMALLENSCDKFLIGAPFYGLSSQNGFADFTQLRRESFNTELETVTLYDNRVVTMPLHIIRHGITALDTYEYHTPTGTFQLYGEGIIKVAIKPKGNSTGDISTVIYNRYNRSFKNKIPGCSFNKIYKAGIIYRMKLIADEKAIDDINQLWHDNDFQKEVVYRFAVKDRKSFTRTFSAFL